MPVCPLCPGRAFKDGDAVRMHRESKHAHAFECRYCDRRFTTDNGRLAHEAAKHPSMFECEYCDREFTTDEGRLAHQRAVHTFECHHCDREFNSEGARDQHEDAKHRFECRHCDRKFNSEEARNQHEDAKHTFECRHCDREFNSEEARNQHEDAKHAKEFECRYCDREFATEQGRDAHEEAKHTTYECQFCDREFDSEGAREQHEDAVHHIACPHCDRHFTSEEARLQHQEAKHFFECRPCGKRFYQVEALEQHNQNTPHFSCGHCSFKFIAQDSKNEHERSCVSNPASHVLHSAFVSPDSPLRIGALSTSSNTSDERSESPGSASHSSDSISDEGEMFHSTSEISPSGTAEGTAAEQPHVCTCSPATGTCSKCQQSSSLPSNVDRPVPHDTSNSVSTDDHNQDNTPRNHFQCTPCFGLFETAEALRDHVCAFRTSMFRFHCPMCYCQFDDEASLHQHLEGAEFTCQHCLIQCCSEDLMEDHLLSHPTCGKCSKSFADSLALCTHVESDHPVVVCWDCDGVVIEQDDLELHYRDSPAHPTCAHCGMGKKNAVDMDEHIKCVHPTGTEIKDLGSGNASSGSDSPLAEKRPSCGHHEDAVPQALDRAPPSSVAEATSLLDRLPDSVSQMECTPPVSSQFENEAAGNPSITKGEEPPDVEARQYASPSPTPSEHGSNTSRLQLHAPQATHVAINSDIRPPSPASSVSSDPFSDASTHSGSTVTSDSSHSIVFVSADGLPDYILENRAVLVATSAGSRSSGRTPLRLSSSSSLMSLDVPGAGHGRRANANGTGPRRHAGGATLRLHCRICLRDPCEDMTATICGHVFCKRCITEAVVAKSECPVCRSATLLYCLFKLDLSV